MTRVLFLSEQDTACSQLAQALHARRGGEARSAGTRPASELHEAVIEVLAEVGIDISRRVPRVVTPGDVEWADLVVSVGRGDAFPALPGKERLDWNLPDPVGLCLEEVRELRSVIEQRVAALPL
jgi:arsenate reductase